MATRYNKDIICAPATTPGTGAISIIRVSGEGCLELADGVIGIKRGKVSEAKGYSLHYGIIRQEDGEEILDEVMVSVFRAPHSYTGEDSVEICCHASEYIVSQIIQRLCSLDGVRMALPGEFTQRAYLNGKMDLSQAEAVADVIAADSKAALRVAQNHLRGDYSKAFRAVRDELVKLATLLELELDFSEEEVEFADREHLKKTALAAIERMRTLKESYKVGGALKRGIPVAIVGAPNAGKSTLLNALLGEDRAIVSDIPGTTRDTIEENIVIGGVKYRFIDTAGIRETSEKIESLGIERSLSKAREASIIICLLDASRFDESREILQKLRSDLNPDEQRVLTVVNKCDLLESGEDFYKKLQAPASDDCVEDIICISALSSEGLDTLKEAIERYSPAKSAAQAITITSERHYRAISSALESMEALVRALDDGISAELVAEDLRGAISDVNSIFASTEDAITSDEVLGEVFGKFCIGK